MKIGITKCKLCQREKDITKEEMLDLLDDCNSIEAIRSFFIGISIEPDAIVLPVMCPSCEEDYKLRWQEQQD